MARRWLTYFLPYTLTHDPETQTWCMEGFDREGKPFGVGAGKTKEEAGEALKLFILESLLADAHKPIKGLFAKQSPSKKFVCFTPIDLFPIRLRHTRLCLRLTQTDVAMRLGISQQAYRKHEMIGANPTLRMIEKLEDSLEVSLIP